MPPWYRHRKEPNSIPAKQVLLLSLHWIDIKFRKSNGFCPKFKIFRFLRFKSAKYTLLTFLPLNIIEQFRRGANFYFLVRAIILMNDEHDDYDDPYDDDDDDDEDEEEGQV